MYRYFSDFTSEFFFGWWVVCHRNAPQAPVVGTLCMPRGNWSLEVCDCHLWYGTWLICTCVGLWSLAEITAYSEETCKTLIQNCLEEFIKKKKLDQGVQAFFVEEYVYDLLPTFHQAQLNVLLWKGNVIVRCISRKSRMRWNDLGIRRLRIEYLV